MFQHEEDQKTYIEYLVELVVQARMTYSDAETALRGHVQVPTDSAWVELRESFRERLHLASR
jgi:hypothetical protein